MSSLVKITVNQTTDLVSVKVFQAENGAQGDRAGLKYTFSTSTGPGAPNPGYLKFNSATLSAVTQISIRDTDFDGANTTALLALIDDSTSTIKARVLIRSNSNSDTSNFNFLVTSVTDEGNHFHINGTYVSGSAFADNEVVTFDFYMTGDLGATGPAPSGTGFVKVVSGVLQTPSASIAQADVTNLTSDLALKAPLISPSFTTPSLGVATATSINGNAFAAGAGYFEMGSSGQITCRDNGSFLGGYVQLDATSAAGGGSIVTMGGGSIDTTAGGSFTTGTGNLTGPASSGTIALTADKLSAFAATTSAELAGVISDETGSGSLVFGTSPTLTTPTVTGYTESVVAIGNTGTSKTIALTSGTLQTATLTGNCTFTMPTATAGKSFILLLNTGAGSFTGTFTGVKFSGGTAPTITATASRLDIISFVADGTNWYGSVIQNFTP